MKRPFPFWEKSGRIRVIFEAHGRYALWRPKDRRAAAGARPWTFLFCECTHSERIKDNPNPFLGSSTAMRKLVCGPPPGFSGCFSRVTRFGGFWASPSAGLLWSFFFSRFSVVKSISGRMRASQSIFSGLGGFFGPLSSVALRGPQQKAPKIVGENWPESNYFGGSNHVFGTSVSLFTLVRPWAAFLHVLVASGPHRPYFQAFRDASLGLPGPPWASLARIRDGGRRGQSADRPNLFPLKRGEGREESRTPAARGWL